MTKEERYKLKFELRGRRGRRNKKYRPQVVLEIQRKLKENK